VRYGNHFAQIGHTIAPALLGWPPAPRKGNPALVGGIAQKTSPFQGFRFLWSRWHQAGRLKRFRLPRRPSRDRLHQVVSASLGHELLFGPHFGQVGWTISQNLPQVRKLVNSKKGPSHKRSMKVDGCQCRQLSPGLI
jgi:hypothetical protein